MAALRSSGRKNLSFNILSTTITSSDDDDTLVARSISYPPLTQNGVASHKPNRRKRKHKPSNKNMKFDINNNSLTQTALVCEQIHEDVEDHNNNYAVVEKMMSWNLDNGSELRPQRSVMNGGVEEEVVSEAVKECTGLDKAWTQVNGGNVSMELGTKESLDPNPLTMPQHSTYHLEKSPLVYFMEEMNCGNSLRTTSTLADEKERERVYDTIFRLPWRCELLISVGYFVCLDSFLSLLTIMPTRLLVTIWRLLRLRQFRRLSAAELSDFGCFAALAFGVILLQQTDISLIYHIIRGQGTIKLYVVYNVLEIFDKLCQSFGGDVFQTLFNSAEGLANCSPETTRYWLWRFISDEALAVASSIIHSFILLAQAITLSTCIVAHNNALLALLVSNNFAEIKSNVFKRFSKDNVQSMVYGDSIERFHISAFILFVLAQYVVEAEYPWFEKFVVNAAMVYVCEMMIDIIKHSFIAKFNDLKPDVFSEFLEDLCRQRLNLQSENGKKNLTFVPLAPACMVIRVLSPVYAAHLCHFPLPWKLFWTLVLSAMTFVMLTSLKVMIGIGLHKHASWYVSRCQNRKLHSD